MYDLLPVKGLEPEMGVADYAVTRFRRWCKKNGADNADRRVKIIVNAGHVAIIADQVCISTVQTGGENATITEALHEALIDWAMTTTCKVPVLDVKVYENETDDPHS